MSKVVDLSARVKPIVLKFEDGREYTLEFNRESVRFAEQRGFDISELSKYPMSKLPELFFYAFRMHHPNVARNQTDSILFDELHGMPNAMAERLGELYGAPFQALTRDDGDEKNVGVTVEM